METIKKMTKEHTLSMFELATYAFNSEDTESRRERFAWITAHSTCYGAFSGEELTSQLLATPFQVNFHGKRYEMAGIGCVSSYPEYRGQGSITALMKQMLAELADQKVALSYLAPFSYPFYRRYGYEQLFEQIEYTVEPRNWPKLPKTAGKVRRVALAEAKRIIAPLYHQAQTNQRGGLIREEWWLDYKLSLGKNYCFAAYTNEQGAAEGYLVYESSVERFTIHEWHATTKEGSFALANFIGSHSGATHQFYYKKGFAGETMSWLMPAPLVASQLQPYMMGRIVDLKTFLEGYPFQVNKEEQCFYLEVTDEYGPWNEGVWQLLVQNGQAQATKVTDSAEQECICATIQSWTQWLMGYQPGQALHFMGKVKAKEEQVAELSALLPIGKPILEDYF